MNDITYLLIQITFPVNEITLSLGDLVKSEAKMGVGSALGARAEFAQVLAGQSRTEGLGTYIRNAGHQVSFILI